MFELVYLFIYEIHVWITWLTINCEMMSSYEKKAEQSYII